jgi:catechol 2,3-dioxygenase-like lactoylglutathione lyase family enzyme
MSHLRGIGQLHISVSDLDKSVTFYRDVLGLRHLFTVEGQPMAFFDAGGVRLYLGVPENERFRSHPLVYYRVDDVQAAFDEITGRGAADLAGPHLVHRDDSGEIWMAFVADPDGTPIALMEERLPPPTP